MLIDIEKAYAEMLEIWGDDLPSFEHEPIRFKHYVKMYLYFHQVK